MKHHDANGNAYSINSDLLTVIVHYSNGGAEDLNALGFPIEDADGLAQFVRDLEEAGAFSALTSDALIGDCPPRD